MRRKILLLLFLLSGLSVDASHIVGGELEVIYVRDFLQYMKYRIRLIYYFDENNGALDDPTTEGISVTVFRKSDNFKMRSVVMAFEDKIDVAYYQPKCADNTKIKTSKLIFTSAELSWDPEDWDDPEGYYVAWERCCRNYNITNIFSEDPGNNVNHPKAAGQTFYVEFPPLLKDGKRFINSTPELFPPLSDYACPDKFYFADFAGTDKDGDSLVYSLVHPMSTHLTDAPTTTEPAPYPLVKWRGDFGMDNIINGNPDIAISHDGILTAVPTTIGLFVFAVKCEEYRDGEKIGEVRRDFQMLVVDCENSEFSEPPVIKGRTEPTDGFTQHEISFSLTPEDTERCLEIEITDADVFTTSQDEDVRFRVIPIGFNGDISEILPPTVTKTLTETDASAIFELCFPTCPFAPGTFRIGVIAEDDACALPLLDTLIIKLQITPPPNALAEFIEPANNLSVTVNEWEPDSVSFSIRATDAEGDSLTVKPFFRGYKMQDIGMSFYHRTNSPGLYEGELLWNPNCTIHDFSKRNNFTIAFIADDKDECNLPQPDTVLLNLTAGLPQNSKPEIEVAGLAPGELIELEREIFDTLHFHVTASDTEDDKIELFGEGVLFSADNSGIIFPGPDEKVTGTGYAEATFDWKLLCNSVDADKRRVYDFRIVARDNQNKCKFNYSDTLILPIRILPPSNNGPVLTITSANPDLTLENNQLYVRAGQEINLSFDAIDDSIEPQDLVKIELVETPGKELPTGFTFENVEGVGQASTTFTWQTSCAMFEGDNYRSEYDLDFWTSDDRCQNEKGFLTPLKIIVEDPQTNEGPFLPPNIVTPDGNGCNDFFALEAFEADMNEAKCPITSLPNFPPDNCAGKFLSVNIFNRWGKLVFESTQRNFRWSPKYNGVFYYKLTFSKGEEHAGVQEYKGSISVRD